MIELRRILRINGVEYHLAVNQYGEGEPTAETPGKIGVLYEDTNTERLYQCVSGSVGAWVWKPLPSLEDVEKKFDKTGGNITGGLNVSNSYANGCGTLYKNNSVEADYGTVLSDTNKAGDMLELILNATTGKAVIRYKGIALPIVVGEINDQTPTYTAATTLTKLTSGEKISIAFGKIAKAIVDLIAHLADKNNPHKVTATQAGAVPASRKVNDKELSSDITLSASDVGAAPAYSYGTTDMEAGTSALETGKMYLVYE